MIFKLDLQRTTYRLNEVQDLLPLGFAFRKFDNPFGIKSKPLLISNNSPEVKINSLNDLFEFMKKTDPWPLKISKGWITIMNDEQDE